MPLTEGTPNVMQRLARLPTAPQVDPLLSGKPVPFSLCHKHHLQKMNSYQMVLHRPVETAHFFGKFETDRVPWWSKLPQTPVLQAPRPFSWDSR
jgi:hypothetical protein